MDEATLAMSFDGIEFRGQSLKLRRPRDYQPMPGSAEHFAQSGVISNLVSDSPWKLFVAGLPSYFSDSQVKELLQAFGPLKSLHVVRDTGTGFSKGFGFCEYVDVDAATLAIEGLDGMHLGKATRNLPDSLVLVKLVILHAKTVFDIWRIASSCFTVQISSLRRITT